MTAVHVVVPEGIDDAARPSGGNTYDRRVCDELTALGWSVHEHAVASIEGLDNVIHRIPDGSVVLLDGLIASTADDILVPEAHRLRLVVLVHMSLGEQAAERAVLSAAAAIVTTSGWTRHRLVELYALPTDRVHVAEPGVDVAGLATGSPQNGSLLCVAAVTFGKGHDVLLDALAATTDLPWDCVCVGSLDRDPEFVESVRRRCRDSRLGDRVHFAGPRTGADLDRSYAAADLVVLASRAEAYGMVVSEALARGLPVLATDVGGLIEALGHSDDGTRPGLLVAPEDPAAFGAALRAWLVDGEMRERLRRAARERRESLRPWSATASVVAAVLAEVSR